MLARALTILLTLGLGACSISGLLPDWTSADVAGPEPAYRFLIANSIRTVIGEPADAGTIEISGARRLDSLKGASWLVCLKTYAFPVAHFYAVFFQQQRIVDTRLSVVIDQCEFQSYSPFNWATDANTPPPR